MGKRHWPLLVVIGAIALFILFMIFCPPRVPAGEIHGKVELGYDWANIVSYTELRVEYHFFLWIDHMIYGLTRVLFEPHIIYNNPFKDVYTFGYQANLGESWYIRFEWNCAHPVMMTTEQKLEKVLLYKNTFANVRTISVGYRW